jgi:hypothetical protein
MRQVRQCAIRIAAVCLAACIAPTLAFAYLKLGTEINGRAAVLRWRQTPVEYFVNVRPVDGITAAGLRQAIDRAFATWEAVPTSSIAYRVGGDTTASPGDDDGRNTLGFLAEPDLDRVLASTSFLIDTTSGEILEADIFFNSIFPWSTAAAGEPGRFDLETIAVHEIGHLSGLGHSALGETELTQTGRRVIAAESVMFPLAFGAGNVSNRRLRADDVAGISDIYPTSGFSAATGSLSGRVTRAGQGVFGAHVVAFNPATRVLVGGFTLNAQGQFSIGGLSPGPYVVRVEPLDDADYTSFFDVEQPADADFRAAVHGRLVVVPRAGDSGVIDVLVAGK